MRSLRGHSPGHPRGRALARCVLRVLSPVAGSLGLVALLVVLGATGCEGEAPRTALNYTSVPPA